MLFICHLILALFISMRVIYSRRSTDAALGWLVFLFAVPYLSTLLYLLIGEPKLGNRRMKRMAEINAFYDEFTQHIKMPVKSDSDVKNIPERFQQISLLVTHRSGLDLAAGNSVKLLSDSDAILSQLAEDIAKAKKTVLLMFYILEGKGRVEQVLEA